MEFWNAIDAALVAILVALIGALAAFAAAWLRRRTNQEQFTLIQWIAAQAVKMAEQMSQDNEEKKRLALANAEEWLKQYGIKIDLHLLDDAIEAAVFAELKNFTTLEVSAEATPV